MKIPHALFRLINLVMVTLLRSPLHGVFSNSILVLRFTGRKTGRTRSVPARYHRSGDQVLVVTSRDTGWWPNFLAGAQARVLMRGEWISARVQATTDDPELTGSVMREMWSAHPADAAYVNVRLRDGEPDPDDFAAALKAAVLITVTLE